MGVSRPIDLMTAVVISSAHLDRHMIMRLKNIHVHVLHVSVGVVHTQVMPFHKNYMHNICMYMYMQNVHTLTYTHTYHMGCRLCQNSLLTDI